MNAVAPSNLQLSESHRSGCLSNGTVEDVWFLSGPTRAGEASRHIPVEGQPFIVGRRSGIGLSLWFRTVSGQHAALWVENGQLWLRDLGSTNGTYLNGQRVTDPVKIGAEDLIHFAEAPFRVRRQSPTSMTAGTLAENVCDQALALVQFDRLMSQRLVVPHFQPIVSMRNADNLGFEILGRGRVFGLESIRAMFEAAAQLNLEVELSQMLRWEGVRVGRDLPDNPHLFVNTHPSELKGPGLIESLVQLRKMAGSTRLVLEIHEAAVTEARSMRSLQEQLQDLNILLAFDDFGAGQARLSELAEAKPHFVKFDMSLIRNIDRAERQRQQMVESLVNMVRDLGVQALAEGIETEGEASVCREMKFDLAQGYLFGRPAPLSSL